ncbi:MAG: hypothetical protein HYS27_22035 [Deltaproteobacteria bacterium]|nr:hypothetical protein [Deltaproteobacteria bacterium]
MKAGAIVVGVVAAITLGLAAPSLAYNTKFCVTMPVTYNDSSGGGTSWELLSGASPERTEDNFTSQSGAVAPRGALYQIKNASKQVLMSGFLDDGFGAFGAGCTGYYTGWQTPATITVKTNGVIQSNDLGVYLPARTVSTLIASLGTVPQSGPHYVLITPPDGNHTRAWRGYIAGAYALFRHAGGETNNHYQFYICECPNTDGGPCVPPVGNPPTHCSCSGNPCIASNNTAGTMQVTVDAGTIQTSVFNQPSMSSKFILIHEMGHLIAEFVTDRVAMGVSYADEDPLVDGPCENTNNNTHAFWSRELDKAAFAEAFADFYAADVWNDHNEDNCAFKYYATNIHTQSGWQTGAAFDCAGDDGADPGTEPDDFTNGQSETQVAHIEKCTATNQPPDDYLNRGAEIDWTRVFWNLHTDGSTPPSFTTIARWIRDCGAPPPIGNGPFGNGEAFTRLDACANGRGANDPLNLIWDVAKNVHTIDYSSH